jgi:hypothetical protein
MAAKTHQVDRKRVIEWRKNEEKLRGLDCKSTKKEALWWWKEG